MVQGIYRDSLPHGGAGHLPYGVITDLLPLGQVISKVDFCDLRASPYDDEFCRTVGLLDTSLGLIAGDFSVLQTGSDPSHENIAVLKPGATTPENPFLYGVRASRIDIHSGHVNERVKLTAIELDRRVDWHRFAERCLAPIVLHGSCPTAYDRGRADLPPCFSQ